VRVVSAVVPVFVYHHVKPNPDNYIAISPETFEAQLRALKDRGFTGITPEQLGAAIAGKAPLPPKPVLLTFDDGRKNQLRYAVPLLKKYGFTATFFIYPKAIIAGSSSFMTRTDLKSLADQGFSVESHTWAHARLRRDRGESVAAFEKRVKSELTKPKSWLEAITGKPVRYLAYPLGYYDASVGELVKRAGYDMAFTVDEGTNGLPVSDPYMLKRFSIFKKDGMPEFVAKIGAVPIATASTTPVIGGYVDLGAPHVSAVLTTRPSGSVTVLVDLKPTSATVTPKGGGSVVQADLPKGLARGFHSVTLISKNAQGRRAYASWGFSVR
jgi:peptidoglycan/xylan/chitin deacetylase (PgdA/CDA1 family)